MSVSARTEPEVPSIPLYKLREITDPRQAAGRRAYIELTEDEIYPESHEDDMGETDIHYTIASYLRNSLKLFFKNRADVFVAANMNLYYQQNNPRKWVAPDVMIAFGVENRERKTYKLWQEAVFPQVVIEVASETTWDKDVDEKRQLYYELGAEEYYLLDSEDFLPSPIMAYKREGGELNLQQLPVERAFSPWLKLEIVRAENGFRIFNPQQNDFLPTLDEAAEKIEAVQTKFNEAQADIKRLEAELARLKGEA